MKSLNEDQNEPNSTAVTRHEAMNFSYQIHTGSINNLARMLAQKPELGNPANYVYPTPLLHYAVEKDHRGIVEVMLEHYPDSIDIAHNDKTALQLAAAEGNNSLVEIFLNKSSIGFASHQLANRDTAEYFKNYKQTHYEEINSNNNFTFCTNKL